MSPSSTTSAGATSTIRKSARARSFALPKHAATSAVAFGTPFISGKDSLNNTYTGKSGERLDIPHTLLVTALGRVPDVREVRHDGFEGTRQRPLPDRNARRTNSAARTSHLVTNRTGGSVPQVDLADRAESVRRGPFRDFARTGSRLSRPERRRSRGRRSREMCFAGGIGADITSPPGHFSDEAKFFSESPTRFLVEVKPEPCFRVRGGFGGRAGYAARRHHSPTRDCACRRQRRMAHLG